MTGLGGSEPSKVYARNTELQRFTSPSSLVRAAPLLLLAPTPRPDHAGVQAVAGESLLLQSDAGLAALDPADLAVDCGRRAPLSAAALVT
jgi:hypothetical protein